MNHQGIGLTPTQALDKLNAMYEQSVNALRSAISKYIESGELPDVNARQHGLLFIHRLRLNGMETPRIHLKRALLDVLLIQEL